jgi:hypothetical protein
VADAGVQQESAAGSGMQEMHTVDAGVQQGSAASADLQVLPVTDAKVCGRPRHAGNAHGR